MSKLGHSYTKSISKPSTKSKTQQPHHLNKNQSVQHYHEKKKKKRAHVYSDRSMAFISKKKTRVINEEVMPYHRRGDKGQPHQQHRTAQQQHSHKHHKASAYFISPTKQQTLKSTNPQQHTHTHSLKNRRWNANNKSHTLKDGIFLACYLVGVADWFDNNKNNSDWLR